MIDLSNSSSERKTQEKHNIISKKSTRKAQEKHTNIQKKIKSRSPMQAQAPPLYTATFNLN